MKIDNPAGRLRLILKGFERTGGGNAKVHLASVFQLDSDADDDQILRCILDLYMLAIDAERKARLCPVTPPITVELITRAFPQILEALRSLINNLNAQWNPNTFAQIDYTSLELCSETLSAHFGEKDLENEQKGRILTAIDELTSIVATSSLPEDLKHVLLDGLNELRRALTNYPILGAPGVRNALAIVAGNLVINCERMASPESGGPNIIDLFIKLIEMVNNATSLAHKLLPLAPLFLGTSHTG